MLGIGHGLGITVKAASDGASLLPLGASAAELGHSYIQGGSSGGAALTSNPQIATTPKSFLALWASIQPAIRHEVWRPTLPKYATLSKTWTGGIPAAGETCTQSASGATGIVVASSAGLVTLAKTIDKDFTTSSVSFSGGASASSLTTVVNVNSGGYSLGLQGDTINTLNGNIGLANRLTDLLSLPRPPRIIVLNGLINSLLNGVSSSAALIQYKELYNSSRALFPNALIIIFDCNPFQSSSGFNTPTQRGIIADFNENFWETVSSWSGYGTTLLPLSLFSAMISDATGNVISDNEAFRDGIRYGDPAKMTDTLHAGQGAYHNLVLQANTWVTGKIADGDWWWSAYGSAANSIVANPTATFSGTTGTKTGTGVSGSVPTGITVAASGGNGTSSYVCSIEPGDGTNGAAIGSNNLVIDYTNNGTSTGDILKISPNTVTGGVFTPAFTGWAQFRTKIYHDSTGIFQNVMLQMGLSSNQKTQAFSSDSIVLGLAVGLPSSAQYRYLVTPPINFDGTNIVPASNGKPLIQFEGVGSSGTARAGTQRIKICPPMFVCQIEDPSE